MTAPEVPDWQTFSGGTRSRVALWLHSQVGTGGTFTKADLRQAFPGTEQVDRRMRDLRDAGWVIETYSIDRSLSPEELRLVQIGGHVWDRSYRSTMPKAPTAKERQATFLADGFACVTCGIGGGDAYADEPLRTARLVASRRDGLNDETYLVTQCDRCLAAKSAPDLNKLIADVERLDREAVALLHLRIEGSGNQPRLVDTVWSKYRSLGREQKRILAQEVRRAAEQNRLSTEGGEQT